MFNTLARLVRYMAQAKAEVTITTQTGLTENALEQQIQNALKGYDDVEVEVVII